MHSLEETSDITCFLFIRVKSLYYGWRSMTPRRLRLNHRHMILVLSIWVKVSAGKLVIVQLSFERSGSHLSIISVNPFFTLHENVRFGSETDMSAFGQMQTSI
jgi:hypothetical protein